MEKQTIKPRDAHLEGQTPILVIRPSFCHSRFVLAKGVTLLHNTFVAVWLKQKLPSFACAHLGISGETVIIYSNRYLCYSEEGKVTKGEDVHGWSIAGPVIQSLWWHVD